MSKPLEASAKTETWLDSVVNCLGGYTETWLSLNNRFVKQLWKSALYGYTDPGVEKAHSLLLKSARLMHAQMIDPEYSDRRTRERVELVLWHLEQLWLVHHNSMSEAEADELAARCFPPDEPKA